MKVDNKYRKILIFIFVLFPKPTQIHSLNWIWLKEITRNSTQIHETARKKLKTNEKISSWQQMMRFKLVWLTVFGSVKENSDAYLNIFQLFLIIWKIDEEEEEENQNSNNFDFLKFQKKNFYVIFSGICFSEINKISSNFVMIRETRCCFISSSSKPLEQDINWG